MMSGVYQSILLTAAGCSKCNGGLPHAANKDVYVQTDPTNPQLPPKIYHVHCAVELELQRMWEELRDWCEIADFPGKLYHHRRPHVLWEMTCSYLAFKFKLEIYEAESLVRNWSEQQ